MKTLKGTVLALVPPPYTAFADATGKHLVNSGSHHLQFVDARKLVATGGLDRGSIDAKAVRGLMRTAVNDNVQGSDHVQVHVEGNVHGPYLSGIGSSGGRIGSGSTVGGGVRSGTSRVVSCFTAYASSLSPRSYGRGSP